MDDIEDFRRKLLGLKKGGRLENWHTFQRSDNQIYVSGNIYDDERWEDGYSIMTTRVKEFNDNETLLVTQNTFYTLGKKCKRIKD